MIKAVDDYQDLLRISVASASNDHRLGAQEAPPAVVSIFLGEELDEILSSIENGTAYDAREEVRMRVGVHTLPKFPARHDRPQPHVSLCFHGKQIRIPHARLLRIDRGDKYNDKHRRRAIAEMLCRRA